MEKGEIIGQGMTAEVYKWGRDRILKLYYNRISDDWISYEAKMSSIVHEAGVPSPAVFDMIEVDGRRGIVFQRIFGKTMMRHIQEEPWKLNYYAQQLAELQYSIHQYKADGLLSQKERFAIRLKSASIALGDKEKRILDYVDCLPNGDRVCHGDFHFNNIIVSGDKLIPIDWTNAYKGNPLGDVARTCLMMSSPSNPYKVPIPDIIMMPIQYVKSLTYWTYLNEYMKRSNTKFENIDAWMLPVAAAKIRDNMNGEERWLIDIINKRLAELDLHSK